MSLVPISTEPTSLAAVSDQCAAVEAWAASVESVPDLQDAANRLAAVDEYLARTSTDGRARVAATVRRLEVRIGQLLGPAPDPSQSRRADLDPSVTNDGLSRNQRHDFRRMAEHPEIVEAVAEESTDEDPPSRRKVLQRIKATTKPNKETPVPHTLGTVKAARLIDIRQLAERGNNAEQIARQIGLKREVVMQYALEAHIRLPDHSMGKPRKHDANRIVSETVGILDGAAFGVRLVELDQLDPTEIEGWVTSLSDSLKSLNSFTRQLKEMTR